MLRCWQNEIRMRSAHGSYMKYSLNFGNISNFVVNMMRCKFHEPGLYTFIKKQPIEVSDV